MGHAGGKLAHGGKLLGTQHFTLVLLLPLHHFLDAADDVPQLLVQLLQIAVAGQADEATS